MAYDPRCRELAEYFLPNGATDRLRTGLAQAIQDAVEDYLSGEAALLAAGIAEH